MSLPISSPGVSPVGSSWELYPVNTEEPLDNPSTSRAICHSTNQQASTIARCNSSENLVEQNSFIETNFFNWKNPPVALGQRYSIPIAEAFVKLLEEGGINHNLTPDDAQELIEDAFVKLVEKRGVNHSLTPAKVQELIADAVVNLLEERGINHNFTPIKVQELIAGSAVNLLKERGINHNFTPAEAQEFADTMYAVQRETDNKITRNREEGTSTIEFRPKHGLLDIHGLQLFLEQKGEFAGGNASVNKKTHFRGKQCGYSAANVANHQDLVHQQYKQLWEDRDFENAEEYKPPVSAFPRSTTNLPYRKRNVDQIEKLLSYQKRLFRRAIDIMNHKQKESDKEVPFDPAFRRIFVMTEKEHIAEKVSLSTRARVESIFFEYKRKTVPLEQERACIAEINAMPTYTIDQICNAIEVDLREHPIKIVDLHQISHLLEKLGGYASSSGCVEREYIIDGQERHCTAIILRNYQDLVDERYKYLWGNYGAQYNLPDQAPQCNHPVPFLQKEKTTEEVKEQLFSQARLLQRAVQEMVIDKEPFDPLFERIYLPTVQERISNGASIANLAQTDVILFVYRRSEQENLPEVHAVEQICEAIKTRAEAEELTTPITKISLGRLAAETCVKVGQAVRFFFS